MRHEVVSYQKNHFPPLISYAAPKPRGDSRGPNADSVQRPNTLHLSSTMMGMGGGGGQPGPAPAKDQLYLNVRRRCTAQIAPRAALAAATAGAA